jgi:uncharacterized protein
MIYLDTSYIVKCYLREPGTAEVLAWLEGKAGLSCCLYGRLEFYAAVKRHVREERLTKAEAEKALRTFEGDERRGVWHWLPVTEALLRLAGERMRTLPDRVFLRSADALHLTCAAEHRCETVYSHDRHLLKAAPEFGLTGCDVIAG